MDVTARFLLTRHAEAMRCGVFPLLLAALLLAGCFPRLARYEDGPLPYSAQSIPFSPDQAPMAPDRIQAFIMLTNPSLDSQVVFLEAQLIAQHAASTGVPVHLLLSLIAVESSFDPQSVSPVGAQGLGQLMPETAKDLGVTDSFDIGQNIDGTSRYVAWLGHQWDGNPRQWELALASYYAGLGAVQRRMRSGRNLSDEQSAYAVKILRLASKVRSPG
jgi:soluble lytic murein transglycosylase-like protein